MVTEQDATSAALSVVVEELRLDSQQEGGRGGGGKGNRGGMEGGEEEMKGTGEGENFMK